MKLFTIGPVQMFQRTLDVRKKMIPYFRTNEFSSINLSICNRLKNLMGTLADSEVICLTASGSAAMEATVLNCFSQNDKVLVVNGGAFGERFSQICKVHSIPHECIFLNGQELTEKDLAAFESKGFTGFLVNIDETSNGQLYNIRIISDFCKRNHLLLVVDAISSFLCDSYEMDKYSIDVTIISSQKGLCVSPGLSYVVINQKTCNHIIKNNQKKKNFYFNFFDYIDNMKRGQTPFTPAVGTCLEVYDMLNYIDEISPMQWLTHVSDNALFFRSLLQELEVSIPSYPLSNAITPVFFRKKIAKKIYQQLKDQFDIFVNPCGGVNAENCIRVAHIGDLNRNDYGDLIEKIQYILHKI